MIVVHQWQHLSDVQGHGRRQTPPLSKLPEFQQLSAWTEWFGLLAARVSVQLKSQTIQLRSSWWVCSFRPHNETIRVKSPAVSTSPRFTQPSIPPGSVKWGATLLLRVRGHPQIRDVKLTTMLRDINCMALTLTFLLGFLLYVFQWLGQFTCTFHGISADTKAQLCELSVYVMCDQQTMRQRRLCVPCYRPVTHVSMFRSGIVRQ